MWTSVMLALLAVLSTVGGVWDKLTSREAKKITLAAIGVAIAVATQIVLLRKESQAREQTRIEQQRNADADVLLKSGLSDMDEASGGAVDGAMAYVVDDEESGVFPLMYIPAEHRYGFATETPQRIVDARGCTERLDWTDKGCPTPVELTSEDLTDLEGAATYKGRLYVITSHGNSREGKEQKRRWLFAELQKVGNEWHVVRATRVLRETLAGYLEKGLPGHPDALAPPWRDERQKKQVMQVEGLAIDDLGQAYIGLRAPLAKDRYAILFRAPLNDLFTANPSPEAFLLDLQRNGVGYGIVSLDFDKASRQLVILGNHWQKVVDPQIWRMPTTASSAGILHPTLYAGTFTTVFDAAGTRPAKPEVLLVRDLGRLHVFFDAAGTGGQIALKVQGDTVSRLSDAPAR